MNGFSGLGNRDIVQSGIRDGDFGGPGAFLAGGGDLYVIPGTEAVGIEGCVGAGTAWKVKEAEAEMVVIFHKLSGAYLGNDQGFGFGFLASNGGV